MVSNQQGSSTSTRLHLVFPDEETAIFIAVRRGRLALVKKLLDMGADPTIMNRNDSTCLHEAAANCNLRMVEELLKHNSVVKEVGIGVDVTSGILDSEYNL